MKTLAKSLGAMALVLTVIFAYLVAGTRLQVSSSNETIIPAAQESERFEQAVRAIESGEIGDRLYSAGPIGDISEYSFITMDITVSSFGLLPCEWIRAGVAPLEGDVALVECELPDADLLSRNTTRIWILARSDSASTGHSAWIEYYAFGYKTYADAKAR
ncbi:MAG: hypothetical protein Q4A66_02165 [Eubacteriales bacterium]|nr:hypothetical protein [Eubacteriales bacterium]